MNTLYENLSRWKPDPIECCGRFDIPMLLPANLPSVERWLPFNFCKSTPVKNAGVHMFLDDYQIQRLWNAPTKYIDLLSRASCVCTPDFSMYTDTPKVLNVYNHYRKHWLGAYWQRYGLNVIPTVCWSNKESFAWCFDGTPERSIVAVSSIGTQRSDETKAAFMLGYDAMLERLNPTCILFYGTIPPEARGNIIQIEAFYKQIERRRRNV